MRAKISDKSGNIRTTLTMDFPYCRTCARRARFDKVRQGVVLVVAALLGIGLTLAAWAFDVILEAPFRFAVAIAGAIALAALMALVTRPSLPKPPATARGEAVILRDTSGAVLCTSQRFAELLAAANHATVTPSSRWFTLELWSPLAAALFSTLVLITWIQVGAPEGGIDLGLDAGSASTAAPSVSTSSAPKTASGASKKPSAPHAAPQPYGHATVKK